jgi:hypothetical protein
LLKFSHHLQLPKDNAARTNTLTGFHKLRMPVVQTLYMV